MPCGTSLDAKAVQKECDVVKLARLAVGLSGDLLVTLGVVLLLFVGWQLWWTDIEANRAQAGTVQALGRDFDRTPGPNPVAPGTQPAVPEAGKAFALLRVPRFGKDYVRPIIEGTESEHLKQGVGHYRGTATPGGTGNFAIAGHRTTYGRPFHDIDKLRQGDRIVVETKAMFAVYAVQRHVIVAPTAVEVIAPVPGQAGAKANGSWLTMTACHPKYSAAQRYVVVAKLVKSYTRAEGLPVGALAAGAGGDR